MEAGGAKCFFNSQKKVDVSAGKNLAPVMSPFLRFALHGGLY